jgi:hypothetical protein
VLDDGRRKRALLVWPGEPAGRWLAVGAEIGGWRVARIGPHGVRVQSGSRRQDIKMSGLGP